MSFFAPVSKATATPRWGTERTWKLREIMPVREDNFPPVYTVIKKMSVHKKLYTRNYFSNDRQYDQLCIQDMIGNRPSGCSKRWRYRGYRIFLITHYRHHLFLITYYSHSSLIHI